MSNLQLRGKACSREENQTLARIIQEGGSGALAARQRMIEGNIKLVMQAAKRFRTPALEFDDLVAYGVFGLIRAIEKFDPDREVSFSTYAVNWIRAHMCRAINSNLTQVNMPYYVVEAYRRVEREEGRGVRLSQADKTELSGLAPEVLNLCRGFREASLDQAFAEGQEIPIVASPQGRTVEDVDNDQEFKKIGSILTNSLSKDDLQLLADYYGGMSLSELGAKLGITREGVRQRLARVLRQARQITKPIARERAL
jgi:RNA polymerase sigma factor (sigma-70 family)